MSRTVSILWLALGMASCGCVSVTTKITGSSRAGAEQLLLTGTFDRAVGSIDFRPLSGHRVYLETSQVSAADSGWVIFSLRREMARQGLLLVSDKKEAQTLIEAALGAYGTDEVDCRFSLPSTFSLGLLPVSTGASATNGLIHKNRQDAVVKLALFAYDAKTRQLVWESNTVMECGYLDRQYLGTANISRQTSLPSWSLTRLARSDRGSRESRVTLRPSSPQGELYQDLVFAVPWSLSENSICALS